MKIRMTVLLLVAIALLLSGCGKGKEEQKTETAEQTAQTTQGMPQMELPKIETSKLQKAVESLPDFCALIEKFTGMPQPKDQAEAQERTNDMVAQFEGLAKKVGLENAEEYGTYIGVILQIAFGEEEIRNAEQMVAQLPEDQKSQMQAQIQYMRSQYDLMKANYGDEAFKIIANNRAKVDVFIALQKKIQAQQMAAQQQMQQTQQGQQAQQTQPKGQTPAQKTK